MFEGGFFFLLAALVVAGLLAGLLGSVLFILGLALQSRTLRLLALPPCGCAVVVLLALGLALGALAVLIVCGTFSNPSPSP